MLYSDPQFTVPKCRLAVAIPTLNEAVHIRRAIHSVSPLEAPVVIVDAGSDDETVAISAAEGAIVCHRAWQGYAEQKNWILQMLRDSADWVLFLDADEYVTDDLAAEISRFVEVAEADGALLPRQNVFGGRVLRHAWWYPDYQLRLFRPKLGRFEDRRIHEHVVVQGSVVALRQPLMHENLKGVTAFLERHMRYAALEAMEFRSRSKTAHEGSLLGGWFDRRRALKQHVWSRLRHRPAIRFFWLYLVRRGFLDGRQGRIYCQLISSYEAMIDAYLLELDQGAGPRAGELDRG